MWKEVPRTRKKKSCPVTLSSRHVRHSQQSVYEEEVLQNSMTLSSARCSTRVDVQPPNSLLQFLPVAITMGLGYKPSPKKIFLIKNIIGQYCPWTIVLKCIISI